MRTTQGRRHAPDSGGRASSRAANRAGTVDILARSTEDPARLRKRRARTRTLPALVDEQNRPDKRIYYSAHTKMR
jgi:hypothetical protein